MPADFGQFTREELGERFRALTLEYDAACMSYDHARAASVHGECYAFEAEFCRRDGRQPSAPDLQRLEINALIDRFKQAAIAYEKADGPEEMERLSWVLDDVKSELKRRPGDQRRALFPLYMDLDARVRAAAARTTRTLAPELSKDRLCYINDDAWAPPPSGLDIEEAGLGHIFTTRRDVEHPLQAVTDEKLVEKFAELAVEQGRANLLYQPAKSGRLLGMIRAVEIELRRRPGGRRRLLALYDHPNVNVRLMAARLTLAVAPQAARHVIQKIADSKDHPHALDAGMCLSALDQGISKPT